jgi:hypothetical protein
LILGASWDIDIWSSVEVNVGLLCASAPALKPLIRKVLPNLFASGAEHSSGRNNNAFPNAIGYLRASSGRALDGSLGLTDRDPNKCTASVTQKEVQLVTSAEVGINEETLVLDKSTRDIESGADGV